MSRLIETDDGFLIEVESEIGDEKIAAGDAKKVNKSLDTIAPLLAKACNTIKGVWDKAADSVEIEQVEVSLGFNFEASGTVYIAQASTGASVSVTATIKPKK